MADITPLIKAGTQVIQSYELHQLQVSGQIYAVPCVVLPECVLSWADLPKNSHQWQLSHFELLLNQPQKPELLLLGTGAIQILLPKDLRQALRGAGLVVETMNMGAAARTYNVLLADGRLVAAGFIQ